MTCGYASSHETFSVLWYWLGNGIQKLVSSILSICVYMHACLCVYLKLFLVLPDVRYFYKHDSKYHGGHKAFEMNESNVLTSRAAQTCMCVFIDRAYEQAHAAPPVHTDARFASLLKQPANHTNYCLQLALW